MHKKKRVNPNRKPISKNSFDTDALITEISNGNLYYAWLLVLPAMVEHELVTKENIAEVWAETNVYLSDGSLTGARLNRAITEAEFDLGMKTPHPNLRTDTIRTRGELQAFCRKAKENAIYTALCLLYIALKESKRYSETDLLKIGVNARLTLAELSAGINTYDDILDSLQKTGILLDKTPEDMGLSTDTEDAPSA